MTHFQELFIKNLRFYRKKRGLSQLDLSEKIEISPNYLNAVENGKNFPSPEVVQAITEILDILPYHLFLESPVKIPPCDDAEKTRMIQELADIKQKLVREIDDIIQKYNS